MPKFAETVEIDASPAEVFSILDDVGRTPEWLPRCTGIETLTAGPNTVGTELIYRYTNGRHAGSMSGRITVHEPNEHLAMRYTDAMMDVTVDFVVAAGHVADSTALTHTVGIHPKGIGHIFTPIVVLTLPRQTRDSLRRFKELAENDSD